VWTEQPKIDDLVVLFKSKMSILRQEPKIIRQMDGSYCIFSIPNDSTYYYLKELGGTQLACTVTGNQLRLFFTREELLNNQIERGQVLKAMGERIETVHERFATQHADRWRFSSLFVLPKFG
jgi:hypothetical protein